MNENLVNARRRLTLLRTLLKVLTMPLVEIKNVYIGDELKSNLKFKATLDEFVFQMVEYKEPDPNWRVVRFWIRRN